MSRLLNRLFHRLLTTEPAIHPVDRRLSKEWVKRRLVRVFPELRGDPTALERAYQSLSLSARPARHADEPDIVFQVDLPGHLK